MNHVVVRIAVRLALCAACSWAVWRFGGLAVMVATAPLYGIALARPLLDLASELRHRTRALAWRSVEGRHFAFHGVPVQVLEDDRHERWVRAADVRRIVGFTATDGALALTYPDGWRSMGEPAQPHFNDAALITHLAKENSAEALRFRHWAEREIVFPGRRVRERLGIHAEAPAAER